MEATKPSQEQARALSAVDRPTGQSTPFDRACRLALAQLLAPSRREQRQVSSIAHHTAKGEAPAGGRFCVRFCAHRELCCVCAAARSLSRPRSPPVLRHLVGLGFADIHEKATPRQKPLPLLFFLRSAPPQEDEEDEQQRQHCPTKPNQRAPKQSTREETTNIRARPSLLACLLACLLLFSGIIMVFFVVAGLFLLLRSTGNCS